MIKPINLDNNNDVKKVLEFATIYPYNVHISGDGNAAVHNAKSILGVLSLVGNIINPRLVFEENAGSHLPLIHKCLRKAKLA